MINEEMIIELMGEKKEIVDVNNIMKKDDENFHDDYWNEEFSDKIKSEINIDDWNEEFFDEIKLNMNDNNDDKLNEKFDDDLIDLNMNNNDN